MQQLEERAVALHGRSRCMSVDPDELAGLAKDGEFRFYRVSKFQGVLRGGNEMAVAAVERDLEAARHGAALNLDPVAIVVGRGARCQRARHLEAACHVGRGYGRREPMSMDHI